MSPRSQLSSHHPTTQSISENIVAGAGTSYRPGARLLLTEPNNSPELDRLGSQTQQQDFTSFSLSPIPFQTIMSDGTNILLEIRQGENPRYKECTHGCSQHSLALLCRNRFLTGQTGFINFSHCKNRFNQRTSSSQSYF